jgi:hypothetical protein
MWGPTIYLRPSRYVTRSSADDGHSSSNLFYKNPIDIHGTAATIKVPIKSAIM